MTHLLAILFSCRLDLLAYEMGEQGRVNTRNTLNGPFGHLRDVLENILYRALKESHERNIDISTVYSKTLFNFD